MQTAITVLLVLLPLIGMVLLVRLINRRIGRGHRDAVRPDEDHLKETEALTRIQNLRQ